MRRESRPPVRRCVLALGLAFPLAGCSASHAPPPVPDAGIAGRPSLAVTPPTRGFGAVTLGTTSPLVTFTVANAGAGATALLKASILEGPTTFGTPFEIEIDRCTGLALAPGASCAVSVRFTPLVSGLGTATLRIAAPTTGELSSVDLAGVGGDASDAALVLTPSSFFFGVIAVGDPPPLQSVSVVNAGTGALPAIAEAITGAGANAFSIANDGCAGTTLASGTSCYLILEYAPVEANTTSSASLVVSSGDAAGSASLGGESDPPVVLELTPDHADFGARPISDRSGPPITFTLQDTGAELPSLVSVAIVGPDAADFTLGANGCFNAGLGPSSACSFEVAFVPSRLGQESATITVSGGPNPPMTSVTGLGTEPDAGTVTDAGNDGP